MAREGFPWQASIYIPPDSIEKVPEGKTAEVNGNTLDGPGHIFRKSWLREVTFTALGADENTHAVSLSNETSTVEASVYTVSTIKEDQMSDNLEPVDLEPEITEEAIPTKSDVELAVEKERGRISQILSAKCTGQDELAKNLIESGVSLEEAQGALLSDVKSRMEDRLSTIITESPAPAGMEVEVEETPMNDEDRWLAEFQNDKNIQGEFGESKFYINYKKGISGGSIKPSDGRI
jgi:dsDNA-binding SOS-regulon protein